MLGREIQGRRKGKKNAKERNAIRMGRKEKDREKKKAKRKTRN